MEKQVTERVKQLPVFTKIVTENTLGCRQKLALEFSCEEKCMVFIVVISFPIQRGVFTYAWIVISAQDFLLLLPSLPNQGHLLLCPNLSCPQEAKRSSSNMYQSQFLVASKTVT